MSLCSYEHVASHEVTNTAVKMHSASPLLAFVVLAICIPSSKIQSDTLLDRWRPKDPDQPMGVGVCSFSASETALKE